MTISATIITLNEERNIARCIQSLLPVVDEILVLDSHSTDRTVEIATALGAKVTVKEWAGYSASKNDINSFATCDYILSIDADEALDEVLQKEINRIKVSSEAKVYSLNRLTNYCGKWIRHSGWYPDVKVRLFPRIGTKWVGEFVHEELSFEQSIVVEQLNGHLEHYSYYNFVEHRQRADKYSLLTAKKMFQQGKKAGVLKPYLSAAGRFFAMYVIKLGILDGAMGWKIATISAASNVLKYKELRRLNREDAA
jgi:glycosyltransferase involved in cell wall biosynthesis